MFETKTCAGQKADDKDIKKAIVILLDCTKYM